MKDGTYKIWHTDEPDSFFFDTVRNGYVVDDFAVTYWQELGYIFEPVGIEVATDDYAQLMAMGDLGGVQLD